MTFSHRGIRAVIPGAQARQVERAPAASGRVITLWHGEALPEAYWLCVEGRQGRAFIPCSHVKLSVLPKSQMLALSGVLRDVMRGLPHVVGSVWTGEGHAWVVDLSRLSHA